MTVSSCPLQKDNTQSFIYTVCGEEIEESHFGLIDFMIMSPSLVTCLKYGHE